MTSDTKLRYCPDCGVAPGEYHRVGCDVERCPGCGCQRISCGECEDGLRKIPWPGIWPGVAECAEYGFWCYQSGGGFVPCGADHPRATADLNRLGAECVWSRTARKWVEEDAMTDKDALLAAIIADPKDDTVRLIYADLIEEQGDGALAEFVRVQCELARLGPEHKRMGFGDGGAEVMKSVGPDYWQFYSFGHGDVKVGDRVDVKRHQLRANQRSLHKNPEKVCYGLLVTKVEQAEDDFDDTTYTVKRDEHSKPWGGTKLRERERELLQVARHEWQGACRDVILKGSVIDDSITFTRGFISRVTCAAEDWAKHGDTIRAAEPVEVVRLTTEPWADATPYAELASEVYVEWEVAGRIVHSGGRDDPLPADATHYTLWGWRWPGVHFEDARGGST